MNIKNTIKEDFLLRTIKQMFVRLFFTWPFNIYQHMFNYALQVTALRGGSME